jgi:hypothetical protein
MLSNRQKKESHLSVDCHLNGAKRFEEGKENARSSYSNHTLKPCVRASKQAEDHRPLSVMLWKQGAAAAKRRMLGPEGTLNIILTIPLPYNDGHLW